MTVMQSSETFDIAMAARALASASEPTGSFGCVYELYQRAHEANIYSNLSHDIPAEHEGAVVAYLIANGTLSDPDEVVARDPGTCIHFLDENTCPCGCFEGAEPAWDDLGETDPRVADEMAAEMAEHLSRECAHAAEAEHFHAEAQAADIAILASAQRPSLMNRALNRLLAR